MLTKKILYVAVLIIGVVYAFSVAISVGVSYREVAWFFWSCSLLCLPLLLVGYVSEYFLSVYPSQELPAVKGVSKNFDQAPLNSPVLYLLFMSVITVVSGYMIAFLGVFLAIIAPIEPAQYFAINGYTKSFNVAPVLYLFTKYVYLLPAFLALKSALFVVGPINRVRGYGYVKDAGLALVSCFIALIAGLRLKGAVPYDNLAALQLIIFLIPMFLPWGLIAGKDIRSKRYNKLPELNVPIKLPVMYVYHPNQKFWGSLLMFAALFILIMILNPLAMIWGMSTYALIAKILISVFIAGIGLAVVSGFLFAGMNMLFGFKKIVLKDSGVEYGERGYWIIFPKDTAFNALWSEYVCLEQRRELWTSGPSSSSNYRYIVLLRHHQDPKKNVQLYVAYHESDLEDIAQQWSHLLHKPVQKSESTI